MNYYVVLDIDEDADRETIRRAFRRLVRRYHPDAGAGSSSDAFLRVVEAYETLNDPERRLVYDRALQRARVSSPQTPARVIEPLSNRVTVEPITSARFTSVRYREPVDFIHVQIDVDALFEQLFRSFDVRFWSVRHSRDF
jgi:DnaJ-class molecular chaperone